MKRSLPLLLALLLCLTAVSCDKNTTPPLSDPPEENAQSSGNPDPIESEPQSDAPTVTLSDADKARLEKLINDYRWPPQDIPAVSDAKPSGFNFYYDYQDGSQIRAHMPEDYGPEAGQRYCFFVSLEVTVAALGPSEKTDGLTLLVSHDKGQTWETVKPPVEEIETYPAYHISFQDESNGLLILSNKETAVTYSTADGGREWTLAGSFVPPEVFYQLRAGEGRYLMTGRDDSCPIVSQSADGVHWKETLLPMDRESYTSGDSVYVSFDGDIGLAVATVRTSDDDIGFDVHHLYFATVDGGESWMLYDDIFVA